LKEIGSSLKTFYEANLSFLDSRVTTLAPILVGIEIKEGLAESIMLKKGNLEVNQVLDYEGIPFI
jgi:hypothetical protein